LSEAALKDHNERRRGWINQNREAYEAAVERMKSSVPETMIKIGSLLSTVTAEDPPHKAHWVVAQCRVLIQGLMADSTLVNKFEADQRALSGYDIRAARGE
jgi:hypothetical protein